ncbi:NH2L1 [Hepatospora eriocheir]|uniref:H/ACA ribonucleoprotein complex subunit 2 n=1 Tax=Hepatospora eriocheir TaxID=1081669 RepID=A0A1X0Q769_9MICR|nr:NH2L1 [Hepatospora eriocheir]
MAFQSSYSKERQLLSPQNQQKLYELISQLKRSRNIKIGYNETTKSINKGTAILVVLADDCDPKCLTEAVACNCENVGKEYRYVSSKSALAKACNLSNNVISCAIFCEKEYDNSKIIQSLSKTLK